MNTKLKQNLINLGLSENEAMLYLSGLNLGQTTILDLSKNSGLKRSTIYGVIETLKQKNLCYEIMDGWKKSFAMREPSQLATILDQKKLELQKILPEFEAIVNLGQSNSGVEFHKGLSGIKSVYNEIIENICDDGFQYIIGDLDHWYELDRDFFEDYLTEKTKLSKKHNFDVKAIFRKTDKSAVSHIKRQKELNMQTKLIKLVENTPNFILTQEMLVIQQLSSPIHAIVIRNKGVIKLQKAMFEMIWNNHP
jgi:HTH-type transcriptional regulator, sugar sensing transcriptional regulator